MKEQKLFDVASQPRRKVALKFSYAGAHYGGLAFQAKGTPLPTVEGTIYDALVHLKLIDPAGGPEGCGWERCGRTDKGVSAAGQVVSLWIRSAFTTKTEEGLNQEGEGESLRGPAVAEPSPVALEDESINDMDDLFGGMTMDDTPSNNSKPFQTPPKEELYYVSMLNRTLPPTIRMTAWSPVADTFSARFACRSRHYKYFFLPRNLDVVRMREGASHLVGEHDFRNLHRLDPAKQLTAFRRRILRADVSPIDPAQPKGLHVLDLEGTAFLYNQVRHIMAVLFLVGSGLEAPSVVRALLNADPDHPEQTDNGEALELLQRKPEYQMADALPLMLWACSYAPEDVSWRTDGDGDDSSDGSAELVRQMSMVHERLLIQSALEQHFLSAATQHHQPLPSTLPIREGEPLPTEVIDIPVGGGVYPRRSNYVPLLKRKRLDPVEVVNARWRAAKDAKKDVKVDDAVDE
jgi:tRNA pseudouridine38/39 synthase